MDSRSLALFRVCIAVILLVDFLFTRMPYFNFFYTEQGVLPLYQLLGGDSFWASTSSLNFMFFGAVYQWALFAVAIIAFFMLLVGHRTKWAVFVSWILLVSFQSRNFLVLNSGDTLICLMLFWALRLPLGKCFSVDSALREQKEKAFSTFSINSFAFILQILLVYFFTFLLKTGEEWKSGQAVYYALMLDNFRTVWGDMLLRYPLVMKGLSLITYYFIESVVPLLFVCLGFFWRIRLLLIICICGFHFSMAVFLHLGLFSWICVAGWLAFLPSEFWEWAKRLLPLKGEKLKVYYDGYCSFCVKLAHLLRTFLILPHLSFAPGQSNKQIQEEMEKKNSWLALDKAEGLHDRWQVWVLLVSRSPLLFFLAPLFRLKFVSLAGDWLYQKVANNRNWLNRLLPPLRGFSAGEGEGLTSSSPAGSSEVKRNPRRHRVGAYFVGLFFFVCLVYALMWNVRTLDFKYYERYMSKEWNGFGAFFHLYQYWNMFAPKPLAKTGWIVLSAERIDTGEQIDLWQGGATLSLEKPHRYDTTFPVFRFRKLMENLIFKHKKYSKNYLKYLCRQWNSHPPPGGSVKTLSLQDGAKNPDERFIRDIEMIYFKQIVPPPGEELAPPQQVSIRKTTCL